jgi:hypothetical protein
MPLVSSTLNIQLAAAFNSAMQEFLTISAQPNGNTGVDKSQEAITAASETFARIATPAIDAYIKSATITIPPGQLVITAGSPTAQAGSTTTPSFPAIIL